jgi:ketol-acid reductoisomerase
MLKIYYDNDANLEDLKGQTIAVLGYGSQGHAQAQNMKDSGLNVIVGLRPSSKFVAQAKEDGLEVYPIAEACAKADIIHILFWYGFFN